VATNGALRVIPGSHRDPLHTALREMRQQQAAAAAAAAQQEEEEVPYHVIDSNPGDVIAFDMRASHAAFNGFDGRRLCTVLFYVNPKTDAEIAGAKRRPFCVIFTLKTDHFAKTGSGQT
jgi:ectoine hydroxylase-related dioxygenase (phytanoyl-CoA dioxygenase family)